MPNNRIIHLRPRRGSRAMSQSYGTSISFLLWRFDVFLVTTHQCPSCYAISMLVLLRHINALLDTAHQNPSCHGASKPFLLRHIKTFLVTAHQNPSCYGASKPFLLRRIKILLVLTHQNLVPTHQYPSCSDTSKPWSDTSIPFFLRRNLFVLGELTVGSPSRCGTTVSEWRNRHEVALGVSLRIVRLRLKKYFNTIEFRWVLVLFYSSSP